jgi:biopolymer transport protein ExbB
MIESLKNLMVHSGATWVLWLLIALSVMSVAISIDRIRYLFARRDDLGTLTGELNKVLSTGDKAAARTLLIKSRSIEAAVALAGLTQWEHGATSVTEAMAAATGIERARLERGLGFLGTVGNNAPFVGLLGTVIGIVGAFEALGSGGAGAALAPERVMGSIAEALVATAVGLVVAIPAVAGFNYFQGAMTRAMEGAETLGHVLLAHVAKEVG